MTRRMNHQLFRNSQRTQHVSIFKYQFIDDHTVWDFCPSLTEMGRSRYILLKIPPMQTDGLTDGHDQVSSRCVSRVRVEKKTKLRCVLTNPRNLPPSPTNLQPQQIKMPLTDSPAEQTSMHHVNEWPRVLKGATCLTIGLHNVRRLITAACSIFTLSLFPPFSSHSPVDSSRRYVRYNTNTKTPISNFTCLSMSSEQP